MKKVEKSKRIMSLVLACIMVLGSILSSAEPAFAFAGRKGDEYTVSAGGQIWYGSGAGGYSNSRVTDLGDDLGTRYSYCVQPDKPSPPTGTVTVDIVIDDDADTGKWNALRNICYYSPSYPGYDNNVKNVISEFYTGDFSLDWGIAHMAMSYIYKGRPDDMETYGGTWASDLGEVWTKAKKMGDALWKDGTAKDDAVPDSFKVFICKMSGVQDMVVGYMEGPGYLSMKKSGELAVITENNNMYSLEGAEYQVLDGSGEVKATLVIDANGNSGEVQLSAGTYTVRESKAPKGYALDTNEYTVKIESDETTTFAATEVPIMGKVKILFTKIPEGFSKPTGEGDASLAGAVYKFSYYDGIYEAPDASLSSGEAKAVWYFVTDGEGRIYGENPELSKDYESSNFYRDSDGNIVYLLGSYVIEEVKESKGYTLNPEKFLGTIIEDGSKNVYVETYNDPMGTETPVRGGVKVGKIDRERNKAIPQGDATLEGAEFTVTNMSSGSVLVGETEYGKGEDVLVITTDSKGIATSRNDELPYGTYTIKETKPSEGYLLNETWEKTFEIRENAKTIDLTEDKVTEAVIRGGVQIIKRDKELAKSEAMGGATLEGIEMTIKNVSGHDVVVRSDIGSEDKVDWKTGSFKELFETEAIKRVKSGEDVGKIIVHWNEEKKAYTAETLSDDLPYGTYTIRESKTNSSYRRTDKTEHKFEVREDGTIYSYDGAVSDANADAFDGTFVFDNYVYRSDVQGTKIGDGDSVRFSYVPFKITSVSTGETHVVMTDKNGFFTTKDRRTKDALEEDEAGDAARIQNPLDDLMEVKELTKELLESRSDDVMYGAWFGTGDFGSKAEMNNDFGALPYDSYVIEEMSCEQNSGYTLQKFFFTVDEKSQNGFVDLETITDDVPEIGTVASVDGKNVDVTPTKEITLIDTIEYRNLKKGETYIAKGKLMNKDAGDVMLDAEGNEITSETEFIAKKVNGKTNVTFNFDGSNMWGKETVAFETVYDVEGHVIAEHEDIEDEGQTVIFRKEEEPKIGTTLTDEGGAKTVAASKETVLIDKVSYEGLYTDMWYTVTGTLMVKETGDPLVENGTPVSVESEPFMPKSSDGEIEIKFVIDTTELEGKELVAFEVICRLDGYKKGDDLDKVEKKPIAEHKDLEDEGQTVKVIKPEEPEVPEEPEKPVTPTKPETPKVSNPPKTGDTSRISLYAGLGTVAALLAILVARLKAEEENKEKKK